MALTAITSGELAQTLNTKTTDNSKKNTRKGESTTEPAVRKRTDVVELKKEITLANKSAQKSVVSGGAEQLLGKIDLSA